MRVIGLIGGIGTGKSYVADLLEHYFNAYIIKADDVGHKIIKKGTKSYKLIVDYFGLDILDNDKEINRTKLSEIVFKNSSKLKKLNTFTHPYIYEHIKKEITTLKNSYKYELIVLEVPLMLESGFNILADELWYVYTRLELRKKRLKLNRNFTDEKIENILSSQLNDEIYKKEADFIINNSYNKEYTLNQIENILNK
ncbi:MAG: dephospho-CoA kinase [bacterium]